MCVVILPGGTCGARALLFVVARRGLLVDDPLLSRHFIQFGQMSCSNRKFTIFTAVPTQPLGGALLSYARLRPWVLRKAAGHLSPCTMLGTTEYNTAVREILKCPHRLSRLCCSWHLRQVSLSRLLSRKCSASGIWRLLACTTRFSPFTPGSHAMQCLEVRHQSVV